MESLVTSIRDSSRREEEHRLSNTLNKWIPPLLHIGRASRKYARQEPTRIFTRCFVHSGFSSRTKAMKVWTPLVMEDRARFIIMKKNKKDQRGETSIEIVASG